MGKTISLTELIKLRSSLSDSKTIILTTGVFDILHSEHLQFLKKAKRKGDILIVGIESNKRVHELKGKGRPINKQKIRLNNITKLKAVDYAFILPENLMNTKQGREKLVANLKPHIYAVSANTPFFKEKQRIIKKFKGKLKIVHSYNPNISTTKIIKNIQGKT